MISNHQAQAKSQLLSTVVMRLAVSGFEIEKMAFNQITGFPVITIKHSIKCRKFRGFLIKNKNGKLIWQANFLACQIIWTTEGIKT